MYVRLPFRPSHAMPPSTVHESLVQAKKAATACACLQVQWPTSHVTSRGAHVTCCCVCRPRAGADGIGSGPVTAQAPYRGHVTKFSKSLVVFELFRTTFLPYPHLLHLTTSSSFLPSDSYGLRFSSIPAPVLGHPLSSKQSVPIQTALVSPTGSGCTGFSSGCRCSSAFHRVPSTSSNSGQNRETC
jgi:hypothetical protein